MDNPKILDLPTTGSELFADCESFLADLSLEDESMIAGGGGKYGKSSKSKSSKSKSSKSKSKSSSRKHYGYKY